MKRRYFTLAITALVFAAVLGGCATYPYGYYDRVAATSLGVGAFGTALGYAATGSAMGAALGGLSGLAGGFVAGTLAQSTAPVVVEAPPPPPPPAAYYRPGVAYGYYGPPGCRTVRTIVRENGVVVDEYDRQVCPGPPPPYPYYR